MKKDVTPYLISIALHAGIIILLVYTASATHYRLESSSKNGPPVVQAAMVNAEQVQAQVEAIKNQENQKQAEQLQNLRNIQAQAEAARQAKLVEEQRLAQIRDEQQKAQAQKQRIAQQMQEEQQRLEKLKLAEIQKKEAEAKASALKKQQEEQAQKLALQQAAAAKALAEKQKSELAAEQAALQKQLLQQQMEGEKQQLLQVKLRGMIDQFRARILEAIRNQWIIPEGADPDSYCIFNIELKPDGVVNRVQLIRSSGNSALDRAAETAIHKASPLPVPKDPAAFATFQKFNLKMTPHEVD
jgi:colicin import membrane protein